MRRRLGAWFDSRVEHRHNTKKGADPAGMGALMQLCCRVRGPTRADLRQQRLHGWFIPNVFFEYGGRASNAPTPHSLDASFASASAANSSYALAISINVPFSIGSAVSSVARRASSAHCRQCAGSSSNVVGGFMKGKQPSPQQVPLREPCSRICRDQCF